MLSSGDHDLGLDASTGDDVTSAEGLRCSTSNSSASRHAVAAAAATSLSCLPELDAALSYSMLSRLDVERERQMLL